MSIGIYVHIPFCVRKCAYCDFLSFSCCEESWGPYFKALANEIESSPYSGKAVDTIFFGGGTPSLPSAEYIVNILAKIRGKFRVCENAEITVEGNPDSLSYEKLLAYMAAGISRISMGFQSLDNGMLKLMGRVHDRETALLAFDNARRAGFDNINVDLIFGLPGDDRRAFRETLETLVRLGPEHISAYSLIVEEGTKIAARIDRGELPEPDDGIDRENCHFAAEYLKKNGYRQYEISNFAKPGFESRHNMRYWKQENYLGFGLGASSFMENRRFSNGDNLDEYVKMNGRPGLREDIGLSENELMDEFMMLGYRMTSGPDFVKFTERYGENPLEKYSEKLGRLCKEGLLDENYAVTEKGLDFANEIFEEFI